MSDSIRDQVQSFVFTRVNFAKTLKSVGFAGLAIAAWKGIVAARPELAAYGGTYAPLLAPLAIAAREWMRGDR